MGSCLGERSPKNWELQEEWRGEERWSDGVSGPENDFWFRVGLAYGRLVYHLRWYILAGWCLLLLLSVPFASRLPGVLIASGFSAQGSESAQVFAFMSGRLKISPEPLLVVFRSERVAVSDPAYQRQVHIFLQRAASFPHVVGVLPSSPGKDGHTLLVTVHFDFASADDIARQVPAFHEILPMDGPATPIMTGAPVVYPSVAKTSQQDVEHSEMIALPLAALALLLVFGSGVAAVVPLTMAMVTIAVALSLIYGVALHLPVNIFVLNVASSTGLGVAIDASLLITRRFRSEMAQRQDVREAVAWTVATAGHAIFFSCLVVMIGFLGLFLVRLSFIASFGIGGSLVVFVAAFSMLTLLPALLSVLGLRINSWQIPFLHRLFAAPRGGRKSFWLVWARVVMRYPLVTIALTSVLLITLGWPLHSISIGTPGASELPENVEARRGLDQIQAQYGAALLNPVYLLVRAKDGRSVLTPENLARLDQLTTWLEGRPQVTEVIDLARLPAPAPHLNIRQLTFVYQMGLYHQYPELAQFMAHSVDRDSTLVVVRTNAPMDSEASKALVNGLRASRSTVAPGFDLLVGGEQASVEDFNHRLYSNFPYTILFVLLASYILLLLMFRSLLLPLKAILMNVLSVSVTCGMLVFIFQWGHLRTLLHFTPSGTVDNIVPILLFCILFGLSMDYEVFLLSRIQEEWLFGHDNRQAVARGLQETAGVITNAALLFMIITGSFTFARLLVTKQIGFGVTLAILLDATIIRTLLVPATMCLLGRWNWWFPARPLPLDRSRITPSPMRFAALVEAGPQRGGLTE